MTRKARIRRQPDGWHVERPRLGFGPPERRVLPTQQAAIRWVDDTIVRSGTSMGQVERADEPHWADVTIATSRRTAG